MTQIRRRPNGQQQSFTVTDQQASNIKKFNKDVRYVQGFRVPLNSGSNTLNVTLNTSGRFLLGIAFLPVASADISDIQIGMVVNNNNTLIATAAPNLNPQFVQGMIYFPTPQVLVGNDNINFTIVKNDVGSITAMVNIFYVPRM